MPKEDVLERLAQIDKLLLECVKIANKEGHIFQAAYGDDNIYVPKKAKKSKVNSDGEPVDKDDDDVYLDINGDEVYSEYGIEPGGWQKSYC